jgi:hypothetical protein
MNRIDPEMLADDARFDRLVDGELSPEEYRRMLASLDDEPGGWRRCAMAFLEAQAWGQELRGLRDHLDKPVETQADTIAVDPAEATHLRWVNWLAIAASVVVLCGFGLLYQKNHDSRSGNLATTNTDRPNSIVKNGATNAPPSIAQADANKGSSSGTAARSEAGSETRRALQPVDKVRLVMQDENGDSRPVDVPLYDANHVGAGALVHDGSMLPPTVLDAIRQRGFRVQRYQEFLPLELENGRRAVVPVEGYQFVPVGNRPY